MRSELSRAARTLVARTIERGYRPVDIASLAAFRILYGLVMFAAVVRLLTSGWMTAMYAEPEFFFHYPGFEWVVPWPFFGMVVHYSVLGVLALLIAAGVWHRIVTPLFVLGFAYVQLIDVTNYLNHNYLVVLLGVLLALLPASAAWSVDARRRPDRARAAVPAWMIWLLRFQVGVAYFFAGLAKLHPDWLLHAQPLDIWLTARIDTPLVGPLLDETVVAYGMSWAGFLFDTTIVAWLSWSRARPWAFAVVIVFHAITGYFFNIGMFPLIMVSSALIFFSPSWPRRVLGRLGVARASGPPALSGLLRPRTGRLASVAGALLALHVAAQILVPLRHHVHAGDVLWNEEGMRFAWHVMVREKHGSVTFEVVLPDGRRLEVPPHEYLTARQEREMAGQPDLIRQLARRIAADFRARGFGDVAVHADTHVSLNGRTPAPLIDPAVDLAGPAEDYIAPAPAGPPIHLRPRS